MKKILLMLSILLLGIVYADDNCTDQKEVDFEMTHGLAFRSLSFHTPDTVNNVTTYRRSYNNRIVANILNLSIHTDIDVYDMSRPLGKMNNISLNYEDDNTHLQSGYQINSLYLALDVTDNISLYHGAMPFKGGRYSEIKDPTVNGGNGLAIINNQVYSSDFISYHDTIYGDKFNLIIGKSEFNIKNNYNGLLYKNEGSSGVYFISSYESGKHYFEFNYFDMKIDMLELKYANLKIGGLGYIYDDSIESGVTVYSNIGMSNISEDVYGAITESFNINPLAIPYLKANGAQTENTSNEKGYAFLAGIDYEFDIHNQTYNIGFEEFVTRGGWVSANHGVVFLSDHSYWANREALEHTIYAGVNVTKNLRFSTKYVRTESKEVPMAFSVSKNGNPNTTFHGDSFYLTFDKVEFLANFTF